MRLTIITPPVSEPLGLAEVKGYLRVETDADDVLIQGLICGAREAFERATGRQLVTTVWRGFLDRFPWSDHEPIEIAKPPLVSVQSVKYLDTSGVEQTWPNTEYTVQVFAGPDAQRGMIYPDTGKLYPITLCTPNAVTVNFTAGYGEDIDVPSEIRQQLLAWILDRYDNREMSGQPVEMFHGRGFGSWVGLGFG
jgi:uncharacterized phiE125 gp8 family phage protein